jgi:hypothetical protein
VLKASRSSFAGERAALITKRPAINMLPRKLSGVPDTAALRNWSMGWTACPQKINSRFESLNLEPLPGLDVSNIGRLFPLSQPVLRSTAHSVVFVGARVVQSCGEPSSNDTAEGGRERAGVRESLPDVDARPVHGEGESSWNTNAAVSRSAPKSFWGSSENHHRLSITTSLFPQIANRKSKIGS